MLAFQTVLRSLELDLTPSRFVGHGLYTILYHARPGDHIAVRSVVKGKTDAIWHHGVFVGGDILVHMHPDGNISRVQYDKFMAAIPDKHTYVESAGIVQYEQDSDDARAASIFLAIAATSSKELQAIVYDPINSNCESFATWCRTGRYGHVQCLPGPETIVPFAIRNPKY